MKFDSLVTTFLLLCTAFSVGVATTPAQSQETPPLEATRRRTVSSPAFNPQQTPTETMPQRQSVEPAQSSEPAPAAPAIARPQPVELAGIEPEPAESGRALPQLSPQMIRARIAEAERLFKSRPLPTAMMPSIEFVTLAALDRGTSRIHQITLSKETFLSKGAEVTMNSSLGIPLSIRVMRANGVNTAVSIFDHRGRSLTPLLVEYPIEKRGVFRELAYYTSAHPALLSNELARSGQTYIRTMLDLAAKRLRERGVFVSPQIVNVAERLCLIEHVDHDRFRLENRAALFEEIYSLFALNELDTYRYSVSSAGAGAWCR